MPATAAGAHLEAQVVSLGIDDAGPWRHITFDQMNSHTVRE